MGGKKLPAGHEFSLAKSKQIRKMHLPNRTHDPHRDSQGHHPSTNWVQKTICCNLTSSTPDDGRMRPKHVELKKLQ